MVRNSLAVIVGYAVWTVIWLGGNALCFKEAADVVAAGEVYDKTGPLVAVIGLSLVCSLAAGLTAGAISKNQTVVLITGVLLLLTGIGVQAGVWSKMPVWYHLVFLALIVPTVFVGGKLVGRSGLERAN
jgi:hypothetical protein